MADSHGFHSNLGEVVAGIEALTHALDFDRSASGGRQLGDEAADVVIAGIRARTRDRQQGSDGSRLAALKPSTLKAKARKGYPQTIGVATGEMLDALKGPVTISPHEVVIELGADDETQARIDYFVSGRPGVQEPRDITEIDDAIEKELDKLMDETLDRFLGQA